MSYTYRGRTTHNYSEYQRWIAEGDASETRSGNAALQNIAAELRTEMRQQRDQAASDIRDLARRQATAEEGMRQYQVMIDRVQHRQEEFERRSERRRKEMEQDLRQEIRDSEERLNESVQVLAENTRVQIDTVRGEVSTLRGDMERGFSQVRDEVRQVRNELQNRIDHVRADLERERAMREAKEARSSAKAKAVADWVAARMSQLDSLESLGLTIERTRTEQHLERVREQLAGGEPESAAPVAETAFASFQTAYLESERRLGVIDGVAEHVDHTVGRVERITNDETFRSVFGAEIEDFDRAVVELNARTSQWRGRRHWHSFESDRADVVDRANRLAAIAVELQGTLPGLVTRLRERDEQARNVAQMIEAVAGPVDAFEPGYANDKDPKSPRRLRARIGGAHIDVYLDLDGTYSVDAYGFPSTASCASISERMGARLAEEFHVADHRLDESNPRGPSITVPAPPETWKARATELTHLRQALTSP